MAQNSLAEKYNLMPWPKNITENKSPFIIHKNLSIAINGQDKEQRVYNAATRFLRRLTNRTGVFFNEGFPTSEKTADIIINFESIVKLSIEDDESYTLTVNTSTINISAKTDIGALRGNIFPNMIPHNAIQ